MNSDDDSASSGRSFHSGGGSSGSSDGSYDDDRVFVDDGDASRGSYDPLSDALDALIDSVVDYDDPNECWEFVRQWLGAHSLVETKEAVEFKGEFDTTALHVACRNRPPVDVLDVMLVAAPDMVFWADSFGWLPVSV